MRDSIKKHGCNWRRRGNVSHPDDEDRLRKSLQAGNIIPADWLTPEGAVKPSRRSSLAELRSRCPPKRDEGETVRAALEQNQTGVALGWPMR